MHRFLLPWLALLVLAGCQPQATQPVETPAQPEIRKTQTHSNEAGDSTEIAPQEPTADWLSGPVTRVIDGDTVILLVDDQETPVRLEGIDAPETGQPWSEQAAQGLADLVLNRTVEVLAIGTDRDGRRMGRMYVDADGKTIDVNLALVAAGHAWHFKRYSDDEDLAEAEIAAREERRGLWAAPSPIAPWDWREQQRTDAEAGSTAESTTDARLDELHMR